MNIAELIEYLGKFDPGITVIHTSDKELTEIFKIRLEPYPCIEVKYIGGREEITFEEWTNDYVQDNEQAIRIANLLLDGEEYPWNTDDKPWFYQEFSCTDSYELRKQMNEQIKQ